MTQSTKWMDDYYYYCFHLAVPNQWSDVYNMDIHRFDSSPTKEWYIHHGMHDDILYYMTRSQYHQYHMSINILRNNLEFFVFGLFEIDHFFPSMKKLQVGRVPLVLRQFQYHSILTIHLRQQGCCYFLYHRSYLQMKQSLLMWNL